VGGWDHEGTAWGTPKTSIVKRNDLNHRWTMIPAYPTIITFYVFVLTALTTVLFNIP